MCSQLDLGCRRLHDGGMNNAAQLTTPSDDELVVRLKNGERQAFDALYHRYGPQVFGFIVARIGKTDAEDVAQAIWLKVWRSIHSYQDRSQFRGWIFSIARNALFDFGRQRMKVGREGAAWGDEIAQVVDGKVETPLVWLEKIESNNQFKRCLDELDSENRDIVKARSSNESYESICKRFKLSTGAAHSRIHRITERLKNCVEGKEKGFDRHMEGESR